MAEKAHIVVVEDDEILSKFLTERLQAEGFGTTWYPNGEDAVLGILAGGGIDLILLDISLPGIDGFEVLKKIKESPQAAHIPVIIISNYSQEKDIKWGQELGVKQFINKASVTPIEIVDAAQDAIAKHRAQYSN